MNRTKRARLEKAPRPRGCMTCDKARPEGPLPPEWHVHSERTPDYREGYRMLLSCSEACRGR